MSWLRVIFIGLFFKWTAKLLAPIAVLFVDRKAHPIWGVEDATDLSWWNTAIRNSAHNLTNRDVVAFTTKSNTDDHTLEKLPGFQWRYRVSTGMYDGDFVSFRITWGEPRKSKGKREFYVGWTMSELPKMRLTFFQFRPF